MTNKESDINDIFSTFDYLREKIFSNETAKKISDAVHDLFGDEEEDDIA